MGAEGGWLCSDAVSHTAGRWAQHTFLSPHLWDGAAAHGNQTAHFGLELRVHTPPAAGTPLAQLAGYSVRRVGATPMV